MSLTAAVTIALLASLAPLLLLAWRDPKRLRSVAAHATRPLPAPQRRALAAAVLLPGIALMALGHWPAFLIWLGAVCALGWAWVQWLSLRA